MIEFVPQGTTNGELTNAGVAKEGTFDEMTQSRTNELVAYNVYRSTDANGPYTLIGTVPAVAGQTYYEYYDQVAVIGSFYYQVTAVYADGCESDPAPAYVGAGNFVEVNVTAIDENTNKVALYPNPTSGNVKIEAEGMTHITVVSVIGQVVYDADVDADEIELNMAQFNAGVYMVRIVTENGVNAQRVTVVR